VTVSSDLGLEHQDERPVGQHFSYRLMFKAVRRCIGSKVLSDE
jgi:hypothetical protein